MPTVTIRLSDSEDADLKAAARHAGKNVSDYVRESLELRAQDEDVIEGMNARIEALWTKVARLEEMAGL